jgi:hypothetical protein
VGELAITQYAMRWNPHAKSGNISLILTDGRRVEVPVASTDEFTAVALILKESPVFLRADGTIRSGLEPVQG